jgi:hypothetical protein
MNNPGSRPDILTMRARARVNCVKANSISCHVEGAILQSLPVVIRSMDVNGTIALPSRRVQEPFIDPISSAG